MEIRSIMMAGVELLLSRFRAAAVAAPSKSSNLCDDRNF